MIVFGIVAILLIAGFFFVKNNIKLGRRFVRSSIFLEWIENGSSIEEANNVARLFSTPFSDPDNDARDARRAKELAAQRFGGKQLPLIALASQKGYVDM